MDLQALILSPDAVWKIERAMVGNNESYYLRTKSVALTTLKPAREAVNNGYLKLNDLMLKSLNSIEEELPKLPDNRDRFIELVLPKVRGK